MTRTGTKGASPLDSSEFLIASSGQLKIKMAKIGFIIALSFMLQACSSMAYYWEKIQGHADILNSQRPIKEVIDDPKTTAETKQRLISAQQARDFASEVLKLPDNDSYRNYADVGRDFVVWTVVATPAYSIKAKQWCFIIVGCLSYRGYFSKTSAEEFADELKKQGMDVYVSGTKAYSTLGWFDDPLLSTMLYKSEAYRIGIIFHELAHQQMYVENDTAFNEAFASTVELEGIKAWYENKKDSQGFKNYSIAKQRDKAFKNLLKQTRQELKVLYQSEQSTESMQENKVARFKTLQARYKNLKKQWDGYTGYDKWMAQKLNNAQLALVATYNNWIPAFRALYKKSNADFSVFYTNVKSLSETEKPEREKELLKLMPREAIQ